MDIIAPRLTALTTVRSPRGMRKLAFALVFLFVVLPVVLAVAPWQQNVVASGRVTAMNPLDRTQVLPAPVTGRLVELLVQEGEAVQKDQVLARLEDQDPGYSLRLQQQIEQVENKIENARASVRLYDNQLSNMEDARERAIDEASFRVTAAVQEVQATEQDLVGLEADAEQKLADYERKLRLLKVGNVSELDFQKAEAAYLGAKAKVEGAKAKVKQARSKEGEAMVAVQRIGSDQRAKLDSTRSERESARSKVQEYEKELNEAKTKFERQRTQVVTATRDGTILRVHAATTSDLLQRGEPLIELIPDTDDLGVELWVRGVDAPLIEPGRKVRLQFEGWPAVQFVGWPSVAVGTFGGLVEVVDAYGRVDGKFRVLIRPDPDDEEWPDPRYLRQGVRTTGWVLLNEVRLGFEVWRQMNAFPPTVAPPDEAMSGGGKGGAKGGGAGKDGGEEKGS